MGHEKSPDLTTDSDAIHTAGKRLSWDLNPPCLSSSHFLSAVSIPSQENCSEPQSSPMAFWKSSHPTELARTLPCIQRLKSQPESHSLNSCHLWNIYHVPVTAENSARTAAIPLWGTCYYPRSVDDKIEA